ncbi:hypothetical protein OSTOST_24481, partial [Ostertagia ostertagi]
MRQENCVLDFYDAPTTYCFFFDDKLKLYFSYFDKWINVKKSYCEHSGTFAKGLKDLLRIYNLQHAGRLHSGIDDVKTICSLTSAIAQEGYVFRFVSRRY